MQYITAMFLIIYRTCRDRNRTHLRLLTAPIYRHDFMNVEGLELRKPKRGETILKTLTEIGGNIEIKKIISNQALQIRIRSQTIDSKDANTYGNPMHVELRQGNKLSKMLGAMND